MQTEVSSNTVQHVNNGGVYRRYIKRPMDLILSLCAIIVLAPVLLIIAILVRIKLGSPVLFKQKSPGLNEKIFTLYKFRTLTVEKEGDRNSVPNQSKILHELNEFRLNDVDTSTSGLT